MPIKSPSFDHEKLDVYRLQLAFIEWLTTLLHQVKSTNHPFQREILDQLDRASISTLLNIAEGNAKRSAKMKSKFFDDARGSAVECAACLDVMVAKRLAVVERVEEGKAMLVRVVAMMTKLMEHFSGDSSRVKEDEGYPL